MLETFNKTSNTFLTKFLGQNIKISIFKQISEARISKTNYRNYRVRKKRKNFTIKMFLIDTSKYGERYLSKTFYRLGVSEHANLKFPCFINIECDKKILSEICHFCLFLKCKKNLHINNVNFVIVAPCSRCLQPKKK